ncbi:MAG TPA: cytochrome P450 [Solirubrobacteraceae bacterium]|nr:cytochrome P450 [Solirubrobacteraceae bacterium]
MAALAGPPPVSTNPLLRLAEDLRAERRAAVPFPPGDTRVDLRRTRRFARQPLPVLLDAYARYGPVFTLRIFHGNVVFALGPEANHHITVSNAANFSWRQGHLGDLIPLLGDGLLTIDGDFHRRSRRIILPAFHRERIEAAHATMAAETAAALDRVRTGEPFDLYAWTRELALRIAMRALFGLDPDRARAGGLDAAGEFEAALAFHGRDYALQMLRGPRTPWARMLRSRARLDALIHAEIARRRASGERGGDILSLLLDARDEDGDGLSDRHVRDEVMTLLFAGHDTTTSTVAFLFHELARNPGVAADPALDLDLAIDETLRLYPPAWIGPRRSIADFELCGVLVPGGVPVNYCSWASHRLPDVWDEPGAFRPERFAPGNRERIPKGAYMPFGGGSRTCVGMRFGLAEVGVIARAIRERHRLELVPGYRLEVRQMPTISPRRGLPVIPRPI